MSVSGEKIWFDGRFVNWSEATVHILTHTLHYGLGVFEGIRCYRTDDGRSAVFCLSEHIRRLLTGERRCRFDLVEERANAAGTVGPDLVARTALCRSRRGDREARDDHRDDRGVRE